MKKRLIIAGKVLICMFAIIGVALSVIVGVPIIQDYSYQRDMRKYYYDYNEPTGVADRTSSWGSISETITRPKSWKQIVAPGDFALGYPTPTYTEEGKLMGATSNFGSYPVIDGSTVAVPMAIEFARQHLSLEDDDAASFVQFSTTHYAYENLLINMGRNYASVPSRGLSLETDKKADIIIVTEPSAEERAMAQECGVEMIIEPVCYDAFVFITHKNNPVDSLTVEQIQKIFSGEITNWKDVGGNDEEIAAYQREENSGSQTTMENQVMQGIAMADAKMVNIVAGMGGLIEAVAEYENATASIGYTFKYYIDTLYKNDKIKVINIDGIEPSAENLRSDAYPFTSNYFAVIRSSEKNDIGGKFQQWMLSDEGQRCIAQAGYVALRD